MKGNDLLNAMENVDDKHILAAEKPPQKRRFYIPAMSVAAAAVITVAAVVVVNSRGTSKISESSSGITSNDGSTPAATSNTENSTPAVTPNVSSVPNVTSEVTSEPPVVDDRLPKLSATFNYGGRGFEGYSSLEEAENGNPWRESLNPKTLPVYKSDFFEPDEEYFLGKAESIANAIGEDFSSMTIDNDLLTDEAKESIIKQFEEYSAPDEEIQRFIRSVATQTSRLMVSSDDMYMTLSPDHSYSIIYKDDGCGLKIPDEYLAAAPEKDKLERMAEYIFENYGGLMDLKDPVRNPYPEYGLDGSIEFYAGGTYKEQLYGYNFKFVRMHFDMNENKLTTMHIYTDEGLEKLGDYPLISIDEAKTLLVNGDYFSSQRNYAPTSDDIIGKVELKYLSGTGYEFVMPYYRFLVGVTNEELQVGENEITYTAYYVPAVRGEYLTEMPSDLIYNGGSAGGLGLKKE